jgi:hypothetical protein
MIFSSAPFIDWSVHLGGDSYLDLHWAHSYLELTMPNHPKLIGGTGLATTIVYFILGFSLFYTVVKV